MAPFTDVKINYGTVGGFVVASTMRPAGVVEDAHLGFVVAVTITPANGSPVEVCTQPARPDGFQATNVVGNALVKALHVVTGA